MNLRKDHYRYPFRTPCELAFGPRPALGSASACSLSSRLLLGGVRGLGARGHAAECKSSRRSGGLSRACRAVPLRPTPPAGVDFPKSVARTPTNLTTTPVEGYLGSRNDEERSEMRYVM